MKTIHFALALVLLTSTTPPTAAETAAEALDRARSFHLEGAWKEALEAYDVVTELGDATFQAFALNNACVIFNNLGRYHEAFDSCSQALELRRELDDDRSLGRTLNNLGLARQYLGDYRRAEDDFREALAINHRLGDFQGETINLANIGVVATQAGRYRQALEAYRTVEELGATHRAEAWARQQHRFARLNTGVVYERLGAYREALDLYRELLAEESELPEHLRAPLLVNVGVIYRNLGDPLRARAAIERAVEAFRASGDRAGEGNAMLNLALLHHFNLEDPDRAEELYLQALDLAVTSGDRAEWVQTMFSLGRLLTDQGRFEEAERLLREALGAAREIASAEGIWSTLAGLGRVALEQGRPRDALVVLDEAMAAVETMRASLERSDLQAGFFGEKRPVFSAAVRAWAELHSQEADSEAGRRALEIVQRAKARDLLDALEVSPWGTEALDEETLESRLKGSFLVEYFVGDRLWAWTVRGTDVTMADLGDPEPVDELVRTVHQQLAAGESPDAENLRRLAETLLHWADLPLDEVTELRIAPDGMLASLPFELLPDEGGRPLIERVAVSYLPSASTLAEPRPADRAPRWGFVGIGAPLLPDPSVASGPAGLLVTRFGLGPLPGAERELEAISSRFPPAERRIHLGASATEAAFRSAAAAGGRMFHFATHTVVADDRRGGSAILLTAADDDDGLLRPAEIAAISLPADLTVLASCRTALSDTGEPSALTSLVGAFLAAGSGGVVATLWEVDDATTAIFMEQLYHRLERGDRPAAALREVKQALRADPSWNLPSVWAAYVLVGDPGPVASRRWPRRMLFVATVLLLLLIAITATTRRRRRPPASPAPNGSTSDERPPDPTSSTPRRDRRETGRGRG